MTAIVERAQELPLVDQGYRALRGGIIRGEYAPGSRLKIDSLQRSLGLSSSPLREALNRLVAEGLVAMDEWRGFRAAPVSIAELNELTHLRLMLEGDALHRSVSVGDDEWEGRVVSAAHKLRRSEERSDGLDGAVVDPEDWSARHRQFHLALLSGCGCPRQLRLCESLFDQAERYRRIASLSGQPRKKNLEHRRLEEAALGREADKAVEILKAHIRKTAVRVEEVLQASRESPTKGREV
jgi:DNA-binding GntR family transcriptional regulator